MKAQMIAVILIAALAVPASAGYLTVKAAGDNPNFRIFVNEREVKVYPDGSSDTVKVGNSAVIRVEAPGQEFEERITTQGTTVYAVPYGAVVSPTNACNAGIVIETPAPPASPSPPDVEEKEPKEEKPKDNNKDGSKNGKGKK